MRNLKRRNRLGGTLVETAVVMPVIVIVLLGTIEYSRYYFQQTVLSSAAHEGARYGAINPNDDAGIAAAARRFSQGVGSSNMGVAIQRNTTSTPQTITVIVSYNTSLSVPFFAKTLHIIKKSTMRIE